MSESILIYLDKIKRDDLHVFYKKKSKPFEINSASNIFYFKQNIEKLFKIKRSFIEETKEEFEKTQRKSDDLEAKLIYIVDESYDKFIKIIEKDMLSHTDKMRSEYEDNNENKKNRNVISKTKEFLDLYLYLSKYSDLRSNRDYELYAYYIIK